MKSPFDTVTETFFGNLDKVKENQRYNFNNSERFMIWIVGFSIGGLSLIASNMTQLNQIYNHCTIKLILNLLALSIFSGIIYRWFFYLFQIQYQNIEFYLQGAFSNKEMMAIEPKDLTNEEDVKEVLRRLKNDFGEDASFIMEDYTKLNDEGKLFLLNDLKKHYKRVGEHVKDEYKLSFDYAKKVYKDAFGLTSKKVNKLFNSNTSKKFKLYGWITTIALLISCLSFLIVVLILCIKY